MTESEKVLLDYISSYGHLDAIVVEGYDGVGKGRVLNLLSNVYSVVPYRPDYNLWQKHDHRYKDRWKVSGFFWDVYSHFMEGHERNGSPMLFDRGVISGAVYGHDHTIAEDYKKLLRDMKVLHILVICDKDDFIKFQGVRGIQVESDEIASYQEEYESFTREYVECFNIAGVDYLVYKNEFIEDEADILSKTCAGCGHYSYGICRHPYINRKVNPDNERCFLSKDKETQDMEVNNIATKV